MESESELHRLQKENLELKFLLVEALSFAQFTDGDRFSHQLQTWIKEHKLFDGRIRV